MRVSMEMCWSMTTIRLLDKKSDSLLRGANGFCAASSTPFGLRFQILCPRCARRGFSRLFLRKFRLMNCSAFLLGIDLFDLQFHFLFLFCWSGTSPAALSSDRDSVSAFFADGNFCFFLHFFKQNLKIWLLIQGNQSICHDSHQWFSHYWGIVGVDIIMAISA